jgi:hypothetical protein
MHTLPDRVGRAASCGMNGTSLAEMVGGAGSRFQSVFSCWKQPVGIAELAASPRLGTRPDGHPRIRLQASTRIGCLFSEREPGLSRLLPVHFEEKHMLGITDPESMVQRSKLAEIVNPQPVGMPKSLVEGQRAPHDRKLPPLSRPRHPQIHVREEPPARAEMDPGEGQA